ncbi:hypothetical protein SAMN05444920_103502 [Nonomuraea solani]|uniref:Uncharacterized protein n=1 Tax=Nonomuraea solani TaxID=1144553 RepID=A0A1H6BMC6_9ACTN|nr:hypothetical protein [Nonomuraea solani]SEG61833.1 hypothetical protein SAMN05444920_103502 [Nonomuraea solani]
MKEIAAVVGLVVMAMSGATAAAGDGIDQHEVSQEQYQILIAQCRYADTGKAKCRAAVEEMYRVGKTDSKLDCRSYSGVTVCGTLKLSKAERSCTRDSTKQGLPFRRAEVECYAL